MSGRRQVSPPFSPPYAITPSIGQEVNAECCSENLFCAGTYRKILDVIAKPAATKADIKYETRAKKLSYSANDDGPVKVQTDKDQILEFDELVVTCPLGWLKRNLDAFDPKLPPKLSNSIESIGWGCLEKVCVFSSFLC